MGKYTWQFIGNLGREQPAIRAGSPLPRLTREAVHSDRELSRFEDRVRHEEALAQGMQEVSTSSIEEQFAQLEADENEQEVAARFAQLKSGGPSGLRQSA